MFQENNLIYQHTGETPRSGDQPRAAARPAAERAPAAARNKPQTPTEKEKAGSPDDNKTDIADRLSKGMTQAQTNEPKKTPPTGAAIRSSTPAGPQEPPTPGPTKNFELPAAVEEYRTTAFRNSLSSLSLELKRKITYFPNLTEKQLRDIREKFDILKQCSAVIDSYDPGKTIQLHLVEPNPSNPVKFGASRGTLKISIDLLAPSSVINPALRENLMVAKFYLLKNYLRKEFGIKYLTEVEDGVYDKDFYNQLDKVRDAFSMLTPSEQDKLKQFNVSLKGRYSAHWDEGYVKNENGDPFIVIDPFETRDEIAEDIQDAIRESGL